MKRFLLLVVLMGVLTSCGTQKIGIDTESTQVRPEMNDELVFNNPKLYNLYTTFKSDLEKEGVMISRGMMGLNYLLTDEGLSSGPDLKTYNLESQSDLSKGYILISSNIVEDDRKLKAAIYRELTLSLGLGLTQGDSKILDKRTTDYDYSKISEKDYDKLIRLIKKEISSQFEQIIIPLEG